MTHILARPKIKRLLITLLIAMLTLSSMTGLGGKTSYAQAETVPSFPIPSLTQEQIDSPLPNVMVIGTGGTLAGKASNNDPTNFQSYAAGTYPIASLVEQLPNKNKIADVSTYQFGNKGSTGYTMEDLYDLSLAVDQALEQYDGAVVTTGTDTMEEIAYFLDLTVRSEKPVVVTGSMRPWDVIGTDAPANLYNAIKLAGSGKTKWYGTVIMLNDTIQAAREVTKSNAQRTDTFKTPILGALGYIDQDNIRIYRLTGRALKAGQTTWATPFDLRLISKSDLPIVEIAYSYQQAGGGAIRGFIAGGAQGIVTAGTGAGGISSQLSAARKEAIEQGVLFVTTTRTGSGTMYPSSSKGIIAGDNLNPQHARILLLVTMAFTKDFTTLQSWFETYGTRDVDMDNEAPQWSPNDSLTANQVTTSGAVLNWPKLNGSSSASYYRIYEGNNPIPLMTLKGDVTTSTLNSLTADSTYKFTVTAVDQTGNESAGLETEVKTQGTGTGTNPEPNPGTDSGSGTNPEPGTGSGTGSETNTGTESGSGSGEEPGTTSPGEGSNGSESTPPKDITGHWAESAILRAISEGIVTGYSDNTFKPNRTTTRAEFTVMLMNALKLQSDQANPAEPEFEDIDKIQSWAKNAIAQAVAAGIIHGYTDGTFRPNGTITRAEMSVMIASALGLEIGSVDSTGFADDKDIPKWAKSAVKLLRDQELIQGRGGNKFVPQGTATRAEALTVILKLLDKKTS